MPRRTNNTTITIYHDSRVVHRRGTDTIIDSSGGPFTRDARSQSDCLVFTRSTEVGISLQAPCVNVDEAGDRLYSVALREQGTIEAGGGGAAYADTAKTEANRALPHPRQGTGGSCARAHRIAAEANSGQVRVSIEPVARSATASSMAGAYGRGAPP